MNSISVLSIGILAVLIAQTMNTLNSLYSKTHYYYVLAFTIFAQFSIGLLLIKYYGEGIKYFKFSLLALFYYAFGVIFSILIQYFIMKNPLKINEIISMIIIFVGIVYYFLTKK